MPKKKVKSKVIIKKTKPSSRKRTVKSKRKLSRKKKPTKFQQLAIFAKNNKKLVLAAFGFSLAIFIAILTWLFWGIPLPSQLGNQNTVSTKIFDRNGKLIYEIYADERRTPIKMEEIPEFVKTATIAIEDKDFYKHPGFSITGMTRAAYKTLSGQRLEGGSTLTQQLVKNSLLSPERTIKRKVQELVLALFVEARYSKDQILEMYLNQIPYGSTAYGIEAASELYFDKNAKDLTLGEAALLAGMPQAPSRYSPFGAFPENAKGRQKTVLQRMVEQGYITQVEADEAHEQEFELAQQEELNAPHFALWIKEQLSERFGEAVVEKGGLRVTTTLDLELQQIAQEAVKDEVEKLANRKVGNGAAIVVKPKTGEILAMVGSKDYFAEDEDGKVNIIFSLRQPGSSIKPLNYVFALQEKKATASTVLADIPTCFTIIGQEPYCPVNYDGEFHGAIQFRFALGNSYNIPAVRILALNGIVEFTEFAQKLGITTFTDPAAYGLSLTLGGGEVRPYDMAVAYSTLANQGVRVNPISFLKIEDWTGKVLFERETENIEGDRVMDSEPAFVISHILHDNNARSQAFGPSSFLNVRGHPEVSVKTGTTNDLRDNWTAGYTEDAVVVTWVGNNDNSPMSGAISGISGASPIWNRIMRETLDRYEEGGHSWPKQPAGVVGATVCANTGYIPTGDTADCPTRFEYFLNGTVPEGGAFRQDILIFNDTGMPANAEALPEQVHTENHLMIQDPLDTLICLDCTGPMPEVSIPYYEDLN